MIHSKWMHLDKELLKRCFMSTFLIGLMAYGYGFLNLIISHDSLNDIYIASHQHKISIGRIWFPAYISITHGKLVLPWLAGILALCWISLAVFLVAGLFDLKERWQVFAVSAIFTVNPTVISLATTFLNDLDTDMFAMLLSVLSVVLWKKSCRQTARPKQLGQLLAGALLLSFAIGLYQSFISMAITLVIMISMMELLDGEVLKKILQNGMCAVGMVGAGGVLYFFEIKLVTFVMNMGLKSGDYNSITNMGTIFENSIFHLVGWMYRSWGETFLDSGFAYSQKVFAGVHLILFGVLAAALFAAWKQIRRQEGMLFLALFLILPFGMNVCYFLSQGVFHDVMKYSFWMIYLLVLLLLKKLFEKGIFIDKKAVVLNCVVAGCLAFLVFGWVQTSNALCLKKDLQSQATLSRMTRVAAMMDAEEAYVPGETPVIFWGNDVGFRRSIPGFEEQSKITGSDSVATVTYQYTYETYFKYVLNTPIKVVYNKFHVVEDKIKDMPVFPADGCVRMVDGMLVVKLEAN